MYEQLTDLCLKGASEQEIIEFIKKIPDYPQVMQHLGRMYYDWNIQVPLLYHAAQNNFFELAVLLIDSGVSLEQTFECSFFCKSKENQFLNKTTALGAACYHNNLGMVRLLLDNHADLQKEGAPPILIITKEIVIARMLILEARKRDQVALLLEAVEGTYDVIQWHSVVGNIDMLRWFMTLPEFEHYDDLRRLLNCARKASWNYPDKAEQFNAACLELRKQIKLSHQADDEPSTKPDDSYFRLFAQARPKSVGDKKHLCH